MQYNNLWNIIGIVYKLAKLWIFIFAIFVESYFITPLFLHNNKIKLQ